MTTRNRVHGLVLAGIAWAIGAATASAATNYFVATAGDDAGGGTQAAPWRSVTNAVAHAAAGDVIQVGAGVYTQNVVVARTNVTIQGGFDTNDWSLDPANQTTVLFGNGNSPVTLPLGVTNTLRGMTLCGGTGGGHAGVVLNATNGGAIVEGCVITGNTYGVYISYRAQRANLFLRNSLVARNGSDGIYAYTYDKAGGLCWLENCTIADNKGHGANLYSVSAAAPQVVLASNTVFTGNAGFGIYLNENSANYWGAGTPNVADHCLFYGNRYGPWYRNVVDAGGNKLSQDPLYVDGANGDYRLQAASPAAASGADLTAVGVTNDLLGVTRPGVNGWDMGAYQGNGTGAPPSVAAAYVWQQGHDDTGDGSSTNPWATIRLGLGRLSATGTLYVAGGVYTDNLWMGEGTMTVRGGYDPSDWSWDPANQYTVIDGNITNPPVTILSSISTNTLSYLTLRGGTTAANDGAAGLMLSAWTGCSVLMEGCTITGNLYGIHSRSLGAGMTVRNTLIARNSSYGIYDNLPRSGGGTCYLLNCTIANNGGHGCYSAAQSSGFDNGPMALYATNTLFTGNNGYGVSRQYGFKLHTGYSFYYGNLSGPWDGLVTDGGHNIIGLAPAYVDAANGDYRLQGVSPAAAAGTDLTAAGVTNDLTGAARPGANGWDLGAYQGDGSGVTSVAIGYVSPTGSDTAGDGTPAHPWASVSYGAGRLNATGTLCVAGGVYGENVWLGDGAKTIRGGYNPANWTWDPARQRTTLFGNGNAPVTLFSSNSTNTLISLTLTGGGTNGAAGTTNAGLNVWAASPCTLVADGCTITGNTYGVMQGGDYLIRWILRNCLIANNTLNGVHEPANYHDTGVSPGFCQLLNCTVANNGGDGCYVKANSGAPRSAVPLYATNTLITGNGRFGIYIEASNGGGSGAGYSLFYGNPAGPWIVTNSSTHTLQTFVDSGGNTTNLDPSYVNVAAGDYRIVTTNSPAYNTGMNLASQGVTNDIVGTARPQYGLFDRGAYEFWIPPPAGSVVLLR